MALNFFAYWDNSKYRPHFIPSTPIDLELEEYVVHMENRKRENALKVLPGRIRKNSKGFYIEACSVINTNNQYILKSRKRKDSERQDAVILIQSGTSLNTKAGRIILPNQNPAILLESSVNRYGNEEALYWFPEVGHSVIIAFSNGETSRLFWSRDPKWTQWSRSTRIKFV